jgi:alpha-glucoside transport system substrate-binding protein
MRYGRHVAALAAITSLVLVACGDDDDDDTGGSGTEAPSGTTASAGTTAPDGTAAPETTASAGTTAPDGTGGSAEGLLGGEIPCEGQHEGKTVTVLSPVRNSENDPNAIQRFTDWWAPLAECTGVTIDFQGTDQFEVQAPVLLQGGSPPDVIDFPQPGLLRTLAPNLITFPENVAAHAANDFIPGWEGLYTVDDEVKGIPWRANVKSMVWYSPAMFEAGGYEIPETLEELTALSDQIVADGGTPWCAGIESGVATGWPVTDWFEDFMLRLNGPEVYDQWVNHEIPFNDPQVKAVADAVGSYLKNPDYMGGENNVRAIATTKFQDGGVPIATGDCYMHRQASFYNGLFPEGTVVGPPDDPAADVTFFYLPVAEEGDPRVMLGAGDLLSAGTDKPETWDVILYATSADYALEMANASPPELSPRNDIDVSQISDPLNASFAELLASSEVFRFDGADMMPGAVGSGTFWTEATAWIVGGSTEDMLDNIEASWPAD